MASEADAIPKGSDNTDPAEAELDDALGGNDDAAAGTTGAKRPETSDAVSASAHFIEEQLDLLLADEADDEYRTGSVDGGAGGSHGPTEAISAFASFLGESHDGHEAVELAAWALPPKVAHAWKRLVLATVHLRFADSAEQQADPFHAAGVYPMASHLSLASNVTQHNPLSRTERIAEVLRRRRDASFSSSSSSSKPVNSKGKKKVSAAQSMLPPVEESPAKKKKAAPVVSHPGDRPTRRASLFGSLVGAYRCGTQEGATTFQRCVGDDLVGVSQALRVRKSQVMHRSPVKPLLHYNDLPGREHEPRFLPRTITVQMGGLLAALQTAKAQRSAKNAASEEAAASSSSSSSSVETGVIADPAHPEVHAPWAPEEAAASHLQLVKEEQRLHKLRERLDRVHETAEFYLPRHRNLFSLLREHYDADGMAHPANDSYFPANLLKREALRFDPNVQFLLRTIWSATDVNNSGAVDQAEYNEMHLRILAAIMGPESLSGDGDDDSEEGDGHAQRLAMAQEDWNCDRKGFKTLNRDRLQDCWFTLADRFTSGVHALEYTLFLNRLVGRITEFDEATGEVGFKSTNEIVALGETDPLVSESPTGEPVFNFQSAAEREEQSTAVNGSTGGAQSGATSAGAGGADDTASTPSSISSAPKRVTKRAKFIALYSLPPDEVEPGQLLIHTDDILLAEPPPTAAAMSMMPDPEGWTWCRNRDNEAGWVPDTYLLVLSPPEVYRKLAKDRKPLSGDGNDSSNNDAAEEALDTNANNGDGLSVGDGSDVNDGSDGRGDASDQGSLLDSEGPPDIISDLSALNQGGEDQEPTTASMLIDVPPPVGPSRDGGLSSSDGNEKDGNASSFGMNDDDLNGQTTGNDEASLGDGEGSKTSENDGSSDLQQFSLPRVSMRTSPKSRKDGDNDGNDEEPLGPPPNGDNLPGEEEGEEEGDFQPGIPEGLFKLGQPYRPPATFFNTGGTLRSGSRINSRVSSSRSNRTNRMNSTKSNSGGSEYGSSGGGGAGGNSSNGGGGYEMGTSKSGGRGNVGGDGIGGAGVDGDSVDGSTSTYHGTQRSEKRQVYPLAVSGVDYAGYNFDPSVILRQRHLGAAAMVINQQIALQRGPNPSSNGSSSSRSSSSGSSIRSCTPGYGVIDSSLVGGSSSSSSHDGSTLDSFRLPSSTPANRFNALAAQFDEAAAPGFAAKLLVRSRADRRVHLLEHEVASTSEDDNSAYIAKAALADTEVSVGGHGLNSYVSTFHRRPLGGKSRFLAMARSYSADQVLESLEADLPFTSTTGVNSAGVGVGVGSRSYQPHHQHEQQQQHYQQQADFFRAGGTPLTNALEPPPPRHKLPPSREVSDFWAAPQLHHHPLSKRKTSTLRNQPPSWQQEYANYSSNPSSRLLQEASLPLPAFSGGFSALYGDEEHSGPTDFTQSYPSSSLASSSSSSLSSSSSSSHLSPPVLRGQRNALARVAAWSESNDHLSPPMADNNSSNINNSGSGSFDCNTRSVRFSSGSNSSASSSNGGTLRQRSAFTSAAMSSLASP